MFKINFICNKYRLAEMHPLDWRPDLTVRYRSNGKLNAEDKRKLAKWHMYEKNNYTCWICNKKAKRIGVFVKVTNPSEIMYAPITDSDYLTQDHLYPQKFGGGRAGDNIAPACFKCNCERGCDLESLKNCPIKLRTEDMRLFCRIELSEDDGRAGGSHIFALEYPFDADSPDNFIAGDEWYHKLLRKYITMFDLLKLKSDKVVTISSSYDQIPFHSIKITPIKQKVFDDMRAKEKADMLAEAKRENRDKEKDTLKRKKDNLLKKQALFKLNEEEIAVLGLKHVSDYLQRAA